MKHLVIIGTVFPEPNSTAAGRRMFQLIRLFLEENYQISFLSAAAVSENSYNLSELGVKSYIIKINDSSFEELISVLDPEIILFDRFITEEQFGWKVSETCPNAVKILDTEDLHFLRKARETCFKQNKALSNKELISDIFKREIASILRCDLSLIISEFEIKLLSEKFNIDSEILFYIPIFAEIRPSKKLFKERKNFISIGNFLHEPNWQTVLTLKRIWPEIRKANPESELHIFGAYPNESAFQLHNETQGFLIKGRAENVEDTFENYRVLLAPIPFGAGIKGKLLECMEFGLPNITTSIGAEGLHGELYWSGFITDDDSSFVDKTNLLYNDESQWKKAQENGYRIIMQKFRKEDFKTDFSAKVTSIVLNLKNHRNRNFLGQVLEHHTLRSTKYLGKWIEEKNKNKR